MQLRLKSKNNITVEKLILGVSAIGAVLSGLALISYGDGFTHPFKAVAAIFITLIACLGLIIASYYFPQEVIIFSISVGLIIALNLLAVWQGNFGVLLMVTVPCLLIPLSRLVTYTFYILATMLLIQLALFYVFFWSSTDHSVAFFVAASLIIFILSIAGLALKAAQFKVDQSLAWVFVNRFNDEKPLEKYAAAYAGQDKDTAFMLHEALLNLRETSILSLSSWQRKAVAYWYPQSTIKKLLKKIDRYSYTLAKAATTDMVKLIQAEIDQVILRQAIGNHTIKTNLPSDPVVCLVEPVLLKKLVAELLENSVAYSSDNSTIHISLKVEGEYCVVSFENNAEIAQVKVNELGIPFYRAETSILKDKDKLGLSLFYLKEHMHRQNGSLSFALKEGKVLAKLSLPLIKN